MSIPAFIIIPASPSASTTAPTTPSMRRTSGRWSSGSSFSDSSNQPHRLAKTYISRWEDTAAVAPKNAQPPRLPRRSKTQYIIQTKIMHSWFRFTAASRRTNTFSSVNHGLNGMSEHSKQPAEQPKHGLEFWTLVIPFKKQWMHTHPLWPWRSSDPAFRLFVLYQSIACWVWQLLNALEHANISRCMVDEYKMKYREIA